MTLLALGLNTLKVTCCSLYFFFQLFVPLDATFFSHFPLMLTT